MNCKITVQLSNIHFTTPTRLSGVSTKGTVQVQYLIYWAVTPVRVGNLRSSFSFSPSLDTLWAARPLLVSTHQLYQTTILCLLYYYMCSWPLLLDFYFTQLSNKNIFTVSHCTTPTSLSGVWCNRIYQFLSRCYISVLLFLLYYYMGSWPLLLYFYFTQLCYLTLHAIIIRTLQAQDTTGPI